VGDLSLIQQGGTHKTKRFTETTKWDDPWFVRLPRLQKLLWLYICDRCDASGVIDFCPQVASVQIGGKVTHESVRAFADRVRKLSSGKWQIVKFLPFQYGKVDANCPAHKPLIRLIQLNGLQYPISNLPNTLSEIPNRVSNRVSNTLQEKEKDKEKEKEGGVRGGSDVLAFRWPGWSNPEFQNLFHEWQRLKPGKKSKNPHRMFQGQLDALERWGLEVATYIINRSISNNYQGLIYEAPKTKQTTPEKQRFKDVN
jgi:hypothetical protein